jgi:amino acid adenylation domain-containing protein
MTTLLTALMRRRAADAPLTARDVSNPRWNQTAREYPSDCGVSELIDKQANRTPDAIAIVHRGERVTYRDLRIRVDQLARYLAARGAVPGALVGVCVGRSIDMIVALLAVLKAGAAYVPLDPDYPRARLELILDDARVGLLVTEHRLLHLFSDSRAACVSIDDERTAIACESTTPLRAAAGPDEVAYIIYTSGSTGTPKGVQVTVRNLVNFLWSMRDEPGATAADVIPAITTICFDIAALEMYLPLVVGARIVVIDRDVTSDGRLLADALATSGASLIQATPATWRLLLGTGWRGDRRARLLCGGEALSRDLADALLSRSAAVWNMYGPTETTVWSAIHRVARGTGQVPIGHPIANTTIYLLDEGRQPVPIGSTGEIYIGGDGVARGYLNRDALTAERFVPDPFGPTGRRLYRTGDLGRQQPDGTIVFLGRADHQVKIRGYRIEPEEIEAVLASHPRIAHAVATAIDDASGEKRLVAHYCTGDGIALGPGDLRRFLADRVPEYLIPSVFVHVHALPLTPNGKIDRRALPVVAPSTGDRAVVLPRTDVERELVAMWQRALQLAPISVTDNFFDLGGHSLLAVRLFADISRRFGRDLPLSTLVHAPTIAHLAEHLRGPLRAGIWGALVPIQPLGDGRPLFVVHGGGGTVLFLRDLARHLGGARPLYGLQCEGFDGKHATRLSVEQMAAHYLCVLRTVQPEGPYRIGGYCFGGLVAFEMAQQLHRRGERAELVALFNAPNRAVAAGTIEEKRARTSRRAVLERHWQMLAHLPGAAKLGYAGEAVRHAIAWRRGLVHDRRGQAAQHLRAIACDLHVAARRAIPPGLRDAYVFQVTTHAEQRYVPARYPGHLVVLRGKGLYRDPALGWGQYAQSIETVEVGGPQRLRREIVAEPVVQMLARDLQARMDRLDNGPECDFAAANS